MTVPLVRLREPVAAARPHAVLARPGAGEWLLAVVTLFVLSVGLPSSWFRVPPAIEEGIAEGGSDLLIVAFLLGAAFLAATRLVGNYHVLYEALRREPLLPLLLAVMVVSTVWSYDPATTLRRSIATAVTAFIAYWLVVRFPLGDILRILAWASTAAVALHYLLIVVFPQYGLDSQDRFIGAFTNKNEIGRAGALYVLIFLLVRRYDRRHRVIYTLVGLAAFGLVLGSESKTGLVSIILLVGLLVLFTAFRARRTLYGAIAIGYAVAAVVAVLFVTANLALVASWLQKDVTLSGRTELWNQLFGFVGQRPALGWGWNAFWQGWNSPAHEVWIVNDWQPPHAHNALFDYVLQLGLVGAALVVAIYVRGVVRASRIVRYVPGVLGLVPLAFLSYCLLQGITEVGVIGRSLEFVVFVVAIVVAGGLGTRQAVAEAARHHPATQVGAPPGGG